MNTNPVPGRIVEQVAATMPVAGVEADTVTDEQFDAVCSGALAGVGGTLLFTLRIGNGVDCQHVAAAAVGTGEARQFLVLSLPVAGGKLRVETAADSKNPVAGIAAAYAGLADALSVAA